MAMTVNGVRLYFGPSAIHDFAYGTNTTQGIRPITLVHVRLPPSNLIHPDEQPKLYRSSGPGYGGPQSPPRGEAYALTRLENACYVDGLTVATQAGDSEGDHILCIAPDLTRIGNLGQINVPQQPPQPQFNAYNFGGVNTSSRRPLTEYATLLGITGRTWGMAAVPKKKIATPAGTPSPTVLNELASQFGEPPNQFMLLTNSGLIFLVKRRAMDYLKAVLEEYQSEGNVQHIIEFRDR